MVMTRSAAYGLRFFGCLVVLSQRAVTVQMQQELAECPKETHGFVTKGGSSQNVQLEFRTITGLPLSVKWISPEGNEHPQDLSVNTFEGHAFRVYTFSQSGRTLLLEYRVTNSKHQNVWVKRCTGIPELERLDRSAEFNLLHSEFLNSDGSGFKPCLGESSRWSCVRRIPAERCNQRHQNLENVTEGNHFGFDEPQGTRPAGSIEDNDFDHQIPNIRRVSNGPGFYPMNFTTALREALYPWYPQMIQRGQHEDEKPVVGGYLNDGHVKSVRVNLDKHVDIRERIVFEMKQVLQWWCQQPLEHTSTFGVRIYQQGAVLINHVDVAATHIASAVIQVDQVSEGDQGWPLEIISEDRECYEVYLQPGQLVLYEGAHFKHGRPMKFRGKTFANVFTHFRPLPTQEL